MKPLRYSLYSLLLAGLASAQPGTKGPDFANLPASGTAQVLVQFQGTPSSSLLSAIGAKGANQVKSYKHVNSAVFTVPVGKVDAITALPGVKYISTDRPVQAHLDITVPTVNANLAHQYGWTGQGIGVAVIDSGVSSHPDLGSYPYGSRVVYNQSFVANDPTTADAYGHGTHVAGIIGGNGASSFGTRVNMGGIAPGINIINLRALDANGAGTDSSVIAAIDEAIELKNQYNIRIINLSLGRAIFESFQTDPLCQAVEAAYQAGIVVVVAAGNNGRDNSLGNQGYGTIAAPGNDPFVITVGAMNTQNTTARADDIMASYSSKGPTVVDHIVKPDLVAPGNMVTSLLVPGSTLANEFPANVVQPATYGGKGKPEYFILSGTSMATPVVSGAAALLLQQNPSLTPDQVKALLMLTATKSFPTLSTVTVGSATYTDYYDIFTVGAGYIDIYAALTNSWKAGSLRGVALSPTVFYNQPTKSLAMVADSAPYASSIAWGSSISWGDAAVWGAINLVGTQSISWGNSISWGDSISWGETNTLFNASISWGDSTPLSQSAAWGLMR